MTRINTNVSSLNAQKTLAKNQAALQTSMTRLSTGLRINTGADDPSGMIAAAIQSNDIASMKQAITNTQNGTMLINTADSALGQITNLLTDIRGLATQVGNTAVVDADMIAANQLQVDSAIQAIDRISQVTKFQGQQILNGGLDFINTAQNIPQISNLNVTQANLGTSGQLGVTVQVTAHAERADITTSSGEQQATTALTFASRALVYTNGTNTTDDVIIQAKSNSSKYDGVKFAYATGAAGTVKAGSASYDTVSKTITFTGTVLSDWNDVIAAVNNDLGDLFEASGQSTTGGGVVVSTHLATTDTLNQTSLNITALSKGIDFNDVTVKMASSATVTAGQAAASYNEDAKELTITLNSGTTGTGTAADRFTDSATLATIAAKIDAVTLSDGTLAFTTSYPTTGGASTDRVFGMIVTDTAAAASTSVSGYMNTAFSEGTRATGTLTLAAGASQTSGITSGSFAFTAGAGGSISISSLVPGTPNTRVTFTAGGATSAAYTAASNTLAVTVLAADTVDDVIAAIIAHTGDPGTFTAHLESGLSTQAITAAAFTSAVTTTNTAIEIKSNTLSDVASNVKITYHNDATAAGQETAVYDALKKTLDIHIVTGFGGSTMEQIVTAINNSKDSTGALTGAWKATNMNAAAGNTAAATIDFNNGTDVGTFRVRSLVAGTPTTAISFVAGAGVTNAVYTAAANTLVVEIDVGGTDTIDNIIAAIKNHTGDPGTFTAELLTGDGSALVTQAQAFDESTTNTAIEAFDATPTTFYTSTDTVTVQALNPGANYNNMQVKFETVSSLSGGVKAVAGYDSANNIFTIQVKNSESYTDAVTLQEISDAISLVSGFAGSYVTKNAANGISQSAGVIFGKSVDTTAVGNTGSTGGNTLVADLALEVGANEGQQVFTFKAGTTANQVADAINSATDSIGAVATRNNGLVDIKSAAYGANGFVALNVISEGLGGLFKSSISAFRATGTNADATINGIQADSNGNLLSINTASLALNMNLAAETNGNFNFSITGGGAQFQLGPDVVSNQQLRIGIQSVNSARLGGVSGYLYQLGSGNNASLKTNANLAAKIVDEAGTAITSLRGRLGAISGLTMATNQNTLADMVQNSETSLSLIQDTDFAAETANLTRAQILSQANMTVLSIANQQPQQVLSLLPRG